MYLSFLKRFFDIIFSAFILFLLSPFLVMVTLFLTISFRGNPFFFQDRPGKDSVVFKLLKFKTMNNKKSPNGQLLSDKERLTPIGKFIRSTSIDELPQLINVLMGDMSIIGPRPLLVKYLDLYNSEQARRHLLRPGITGWAQVNGRNAISWNDKFKYDVWYVDNVSFGVDCRIFILTLKKVLFRENITAVNSSSSEAFNGKN
jgi:lipopolysaccharide/colanic/teichoic acid biosynthesis glycosyltransferase